MGRSKEQRFKAEFLLREGVSVGEVSKQMGIPKTTISTWNCEMKKGDNYADLVGKGAWKETLRYRERQLRFAEHMETLSDEMFFVCSEVLREASGLDLENKECSEGLKNTHENIISPRSVVPYVKSYIDLMNAATDCRRRALAAECLIEAKLDVYNVNRNYEYEPIRARLLKDIKL